MTDIELIQEALDEIINPSRAPVLSPAASKRNKLIYNLKNRLKQPEKEWQGITEVQIKSIGTDEGYCSGFKDGVLWAEQVLKERNS